MTMKPLAAADSGTLEPSGQRPRRRAPGWRFAVANAAIFAASLLCGFVATGFHPDTAACEAASMMSEARVVIDTPAEPDTGDDHGHENPVLYLAVYLDQVSQSKSGREVLEFDVAIAARAKPGLDYSFQTRIEDDMGRAIRAQMPGQAQALASGKSAVHPYSVPDDLAAGYYKATIEASAQSESGAVEQSKSVFFYVDARGSVTPMDRTEWLQRSQASLGTTKPVFPVRASATPTRP